MTETVFIEHKLSGDEWRVWPRCKRSQLYKDRLGSFSLPNNPLITIEYFRNLGYDVEVSTHTLVFNYDAYEVINSS